MWIYLKSLFYRLFRSEITSEAIINYNFLKKASKLAKKNRITLFRGGFKALEEALYDQDNIVYILTVKKDKTRRTFNLKQWFKDF